MQRGREEVRVYVRLPADERNSITDVEGYLLRTPSGAEVPVTECSLAEPRRITAGRSTERMVSASSQSRRTWTPR